MGSIVSAVAAVHTPYILSLAETIEQPLRDRVAAGFHQLGEIVRQADPEVLVIFSSEHVVNLSPRCAPPWLVGTGERHPIYHEPHFLLPEGSLHGDPELATGLIAALADDIDLAHSSELQVDHGTVMPLHLMGLDPAIPVVVILINSLFEPLPPLRRCQALGRAVARYINSDACSSRVGLIATGGLSHSVGELTMGEVDEAFDHDFLAMLCSSDSDALAALPPERIAKAGNGTAEVRNWIALQAAVPQWQAEVVLSEPFVPAWLMGVHQVAWRPAEAEVEAHV